MNPPHSFLRFPMSELSGGTLQPAGQHDFDIIIGLITRFRPAFIVRELARIYPGDFAAAEAFDSCEHQVLLAAMTYNLYLLTDPEFDAADSLCIQLESADADDRIRDHPIADSIAVRQMVTGLTTKLANLDPDTAKALWASLSFAQDAQLSAFELMTAPWWTSTFILTWPSRATRRST